MHSMFDHVEFPVNDIVKSGNFFFNALAELGIAEHFYDEPGGSAGFGVGNVTALLIFKGEVGPRKLHICFKATSREQVIAAYNVALANGGQDNGPPGYRDHYSRGYYAAFTLDPDGNNIEFLFRDDNPGDSS
jgi:catechol 2,3-dioxygenase-like lactoylglutathione lyase family enzyme